MTDPALVIATKRRNIETKTGRTLEDLRGDILGSGFVKHGELRAFAMDTFAVGYGDANALAHHAPEMKGASTASGDVDDLAEIYPPKKSHRRPIHDALVTAIAPWDDYQLAPKKAYIAFRRTRSSLCSAPGRTSESSLGSFVRTRLAATGS